MIYTLQNIIEKVRWQSNQNTATVSMPKNTLMSCIDDAQNEIADVILDARPDLLSNYFDLTLTGAERYYIPSYIPFDFETILMAEDITSSDNPLGTIPTDWFDRMQYRTDEIYATYRAPWSIRDQYIEFPNEPNNQTWRIWYTRRPVGLFCGTVAAAGSTSITFPATPSYGDVQPVNDYLIGMKVYSGGEVRTITDFVGSTRVATIGEAWGSTPTTTSTFSILSPLPERFHQFIADVATEMVRIGQDDDGNTIRAMVERKLAKHIKRIERPQIQTPEFVRQVSRF